MKIPHCQHTFDRFGGRCTRCGESQRETVLGPPDMEPSIEEIQKHVKRILKSQDTQRTELFWVAESLGDYATNGYETGMGRTIGSTKDIWSARRFASPEDIMRGMGGHYRSYTPVQVKMESAMEIVGTGKFPPESDDDL